MSELSIKQAEELCIIEHFTILVSFENLIGLLDTHPIKVRNHIRSFANNTEYILPFL